jgi:hypothetical protein
MTATQLDVFTHPTPSSPAAKFARWIATARGVELYREIERRVLACANAGEARIEVNRITADVRRGPPPEGIDNSIRSRISRQLIADHPHLAGKIEVRPLKEDG